MLVIQVGGHPMVIPVVHVREVLRSLRVTRVPGAPRVLIGLANVRGDIVTVLDGSVALGAVGSGRPAATSDGVPHDPQVMRGAEPGPVVLLEHGTLVAGLQVDSVKSVPIRDDGPLAPANTGPDVETRDQLAAPCAGRFQVEGVDLMVLDVPALFTRYLILSKE